MADEELKTVAQPADLSGDDGNFFLCAQAVYAAERVADRGDVPGAYQGLQKAQRYAYQIQDPTRIPQALALYQRGQEYVAAKEADAPALQNAAAASDATYVQAQKLNEGQIREAANEGADLQSALDAQARGEDPTFAYNKGYVERKAIAGVSEVAKVGAGITGAALAPFRSYLIAAAVLAVVGGLAYLWILKKQAGAVASVAGAAA